MAAASLRRDLGFLVDAPEPLIRDLLAWLEQGPKPYGEVMEAWRTSCPRLPVWEDAVDSGLVRHDGQLVELTESGRNRLKNGAAR